jgi:hypothetical protein
VNPVPVHLVAGATRSERSALVARLLEKDTTWRALVPSTCPCCVGRVELQVNLARLLRDEKPARVFVELPDPAHLAAFRKALAEWPLSQYLRPVRLLRLSEDATIAADELRCAED